MSNRNDYTGEQWQAIASAPLAAGLFITLADASGPVGLVKEAMAVSRAIAESATGNAPEVVQVLAKAVEVGGRPVMPDMPAGDRVTARLALASVLRAAITAVETESPGEAAGYRAWLASVGVKVAEASKEGTFLGFGGTLVSAEEQRALAELGSLLGLAAPGGDAATT